MANRTLLEHLISNWPVKLLSLIAAFVLFLFYQLNTLEQRYLSIPLRIVVDDTLIPASSYPHNVRVTLRGTGDDIFLVTEEDIEVYADFSRQREEGVHEAPVMFSWKRNPETGESVEVRLDPPEISLSLERKIARSLQVVPVIIGYPQKGFELSHHLITPTTVQVEGPRSHVEGLKEVKTEEIDLTGRNADFTLRVRLDSRDSLIVFPGGDIVEFEGLIQETVLLKTFEPVGIIAMDLDPRFVTAEPLPEGSVKVQGNQAALEAVDSIQVRLMVDCSGIAEEGTYTLKTVPDLPAGLMVLMYEPEEVILNVREEDIP